MMDIVDKATRSRMMSAIRGKNTKPEMVVRRYLHRAGLRYRLHVPDLPGKPDIVLPRYRTVVFVHGCFWHQHSGCQYAVKPKSNIEFWKEKLAANVQRDARHVRQLQGAGWRVLIFWECQTGSDYALTELVEKIKDTDTLATSHSCCSASCR